MTRLVHFQEKKSWKPSDLNWWLTQRHRHCPLIADNLYLSAQGTQINWVALAVLGAVKTQYFKLQNIDAFCIGDYSPDYEVQADLAPAHWDHRVSVDEVLSSNEERFAYDAIYAAAAKFLDGMAERRRGDPEPLPRPPAPAPKPPAPAPKPPAPAPKPPAPAPEPEPPPPVKRDWLSVAIPVISAIVIVLADLLGPWGGVLKMVWGVIKTIIGG